MTNQRKRLGEILMGAGLINETQLRTALSSQKTWGGRVGSTLVRLGFVKEEDLLRCLSAQLRLPSVDFSKIKISPRTLRLIPLRVADKYNVIPVALKEEMGKKSVILAMSDPTNSYSISEIQFQTGLAIRPVVAAESAISRAIDEYYRKQKSPEPRGFQNSEISRRTASDEMIILHKGDERAVGTLDGLDAGGLVRLLIRVLEEKGVITAAELEAAVGRTL